MRPAWTARAAERPDSVSRFRRCKSARISAAPLIAKIAVFFEGLIDDVFQLRRKVRIQSHRGDRVTFQNGVKNHAGTFSAKGHGAGRHLVEHGPE